MTAVSEKRAKSGQYRLIYEKETRSFLLSRLDQSLLSMQNLIKKKPKQTIRINDISINFI